MKDVFMEKDMAYDLGDILLIIIIVFGGKSIIYRVVEFFLAVNKSSLVLHFSFHLLQSLLLVALTLGFVKFKYNYSLVNFGLKKTKLIKIINYGLLGGMSIWLVIMFVNNFIHSIIIKLFDFNPPAQGTIRSLLGSDNLFWFIAHSLLIIIIAPITEEIFFRGLIYPYCKNKLGIIKGSLINGIVFAVAHLNFWIFIPTFIGGVALAWIYEQTRSLYPAMIAHSTWNCIVIFLVYILWEVG
ncbi:MAG: CPBP family intramembrane glutamic endopeptidase [Bacillota bacterium]